MRKITVDPWLNRIQVFRIKILLGIASDKELEAYNKESNYTNLTPTEFEKEFIDILKLSTARANLDLATVYDRDYLSYDWEYKYNLNIYKKYIDKYSYAGVLAQVTHIIKVDETYEKKEVPVTNILKDLGLYRKPIKQKRK